MNWCVVQAAAVYSFWNNNGGISLKKAIINTDGASRGNPGQAAIGATIKDGSGRLVATISRRIGRATNNEAEYQAIIAALEETLKRGIRRVVLYADSELVVKQINGRYRVKKSNLRPLYQQIVRLFDRLESIQVSCIPRSHNWQADRLANEALDQAQV